jgi:hypothetical protein
MSSGFLEGTARWRGGMSDVQSNLRRAVTLKVIGEKKFGDEIARVYQELRANGWEETMRRRRGEPAEKKVKVTIGEYIDAVRSQSLIHAKTIESYAAALRKIASDIHNVTDKKRATWRARVDAIKLATLSAEMIEAWRADFIKRKTVNPLKKKSARVSANSFIGRARSLFGAGTIARVRDLVEIPNPIPFAGVKVEKVRVPCYRSTFDMAAKARARNLATAHPEQYKIFLLGAMAGLRRCRGVSPP